MEPYTLPRKLPLQFPTTITGAIVSSMIWGQITMYPSNPVGAILCRWQVTVPTAVVGLTAGYLWWSLSSEAAWHQITSGTLVMVGFSLLIATYASLNSSEMRDALAPKFVDQTHKDRWTNFIDYILHWAVLSLMLYFVALVVSSSINLRPEAAHFVIETASQTNKAATAPLTVNLYQSAWINLALMALSIVFVSYCVCLTKKAFDEYDKLRK